MPFTATYVKYYGLGSDISGRTHYPFTAGQAPSGGTTLSDTEDGNNDGELAVGAEVNWSSSSIGTQTLVGVTDQGFPVIHSTHSNLYYVLTPGNHYANQPFNLIETSYTMCFAAGTGIATPEGERPIERLARGDMVLTADGRTVPVIWLGQKTCQRWVSGEHMQPVRIRAGALGHGQPSRDLLVTADHGIVLEGLVINASALVNGWSIIWEPAERLGDVVIYYHIETEAHDVILAQGVAAETFVDSESRRHFDNFASYQALYPEERTIPEMRVQRVTSRRLLPGGLKAHLDRQPEVLWS